LIRALTTIPRRPADHGSAPPIRGHVETWKGARCRRAALATYSRLALRNEEAARALGISDESFDKYVKPYVRVVRWGSLRIYPVEELARFLRDEASLPPVDELRRSPSVGGRARE
jgi:hypothetical protein